MSDEKNMLTDTESLLPTPSEYGEICSDSKKASDYHSQIQWLLPLCSRLQFCEKCSLVDSSKLNCYCSEGCYLEQLGLMENPKLQSLSSLISSLALFFGKYTSLYGSMINQKEVLDNMQKSIESENMKLENDKQQLAKDTKEFQEKKSKLGRPSDFENRRFMYELYWVQVNPKPSLRELGKKFTPPLSASQVNRDLIKLGYKPNSTPSKSKSNNDML